MPDYHKAARGARLRIPAATYNALLSNAQRAELEQNGTAAAGQTNAAPAQNIVLVKNTSQNTIPQHGVLAITGVVHDPTNTSTRPAFLERPILTGSPATGSNADQERFVVALEPIPADAIGRAAASGVFPCRVHIVSTSHRYAKPKLNDATQLQSAACGLVQLLWAEPTTGLNKWAVGVM